MTPQQCFPHVEHQKCVKCDHISSWDVLCVSSLTTLGNNYRVFVGSVHDGCACQRVPVPLLSGLSSERLLCVFWSTLCAWDVDQSHLCRTAWSSFRMGLVPATSPALPSLAALSHSRWDITYKTRLINRHTVVLELHCYLWARKVCGNWWTILAELVKCMSSMILSDFIWK